jgi:hypothetical protein
MFRRRNSCAIRRVSKVVFLEESVVASRKNMRAKIHPRTNIARSRRAAATSAKTLASGAVLTGAFDWIVQRAFGRRSSFLTSVLLSVVTALVAAKLGQLAARRS